MFKKYKQLIIGFLLGALVFSVVPVGAAIEEYLLQKSETKLVLDGVEYTDEKLPILYYQGYNYIPAATFGRICTNIDVGFEWISGVNEIQITTTKIQTNSNAKETLFIAKEDVMISEKDGLTILNYKDKEYISYISFKDKFPDGMEMSYEAGKNRIFIYTYEKDEEGRHIIESIILDDIPHMLYGAKTWIELDYYKNNILSLLK